jgi:hypothetical protein
VVGHLLSSQGSVTRLGEGSKGRCGCPYPHADVVSDVVPFMQTTRVPWLHIGCIDGRRTPVRRPNCMR